MPSRRRFKERILREAAGYAAQFSSLDQQLASLLPASAATASSPLLTLESSRAALLTATQLRDYILGIVTGTANIPENLAIVGNLTVNGNVTLGDANTDTLTLAARLISNLEPSTTNARNLGSASLVWANVWATTFTGALVGNASTASAWQTGRTLTIGATGKTVDGSANVSWSLAEIGGGDVTGPASATDNAVVRFDATTGKLIQNSAVIIADTGTMAIAAGSTTDALTVTTTGAVIASFRRDASTRLDISVDATTGVVTYNASVTGNINTRHYFPDAMEVSAVGTAGPSVAFAIVGNRQGSGTLTQYIGTTTYAQWSSSGTVTELIGISSSATRPGAGTITNAIAYHAPAISTVSANAYGLLLNNVTGGTTSNYAIYTNTGLVRFGDSVQVASGTLQVGTATGATGIAMTAGRDNLSWAEGSGASFANLFRQANSAATIIASGYKYTSTVNGFASSTGVSWAKAALAIGFSGGFYFYADAAAAVANGTDVTPTQRMVLENSGRLGLGASAPDVMFSVAAPSGGLPASSGTTPTAISRFKTSANNAMYSGIDTASPFGGWVQMADVTALGTFYPYLINPLGGNVGIGITNPAYPLQVRRSGGAGSLGVTVDGVTGITRAVQYYAVGDTTTVTTGHVFYTRNSTATDILAMAIAAAGKVGIGTSNPTDPLHIVASGSALLRLESSGSVGAEMRIINLTGEAAISASANDIEFRTSSGNTLMLTVKNTGAVTFNPRATPASPAKGDVYYDSTTDKLRCYDGTVWNDLF